MELLQYKLLRKIFLNLAISEAQRNIFVSFISLKMKLSENLAFIIISCHFHNADQM